MNCPKCNSSMETVKFEEIEIDRCTQCKGIWFDALEHEHLRDIKGSQSIDIGKPVGDAKSRPTVKCDCPVCHAPMIRMVDHRQPHIEFESCTICYGVFLDAGEFKDYKTKTPVDFIRDLRARHKRKHRA